jgi:26S proteasome regulatory subunit N11
VAVVIDPIQSVRGKVVIDAFRLINPILGMGGHEPRQTTSVNGHLNKPSIEAMYKGLNKYYYSININYKTNELEQKMLLNLYKNKWNNALKLKDQEQTTEQSSEHFGRVGRWCEEWGRRIEDETRKDRKELAIKNTGKLDPKRHISEAV